MEEDDPSHASRPLIGSPVDAGRSFTLYLYDREKHHVSHGSWSGWLVACPHACTLSREGWAGQLGCVGRELVLMEELRA
jgi:hypothetical protein